MCRFGHVSFTLEEVTRRPEGPEGAHVLTLGWKLLEFVVLLKDASLLGRRLLLFREVGAHFDLDGGSEGSCGGLAVATPEEVDDDQPIRGERREIR